MARGVGGEDGPSLWMFLCVILVWAWLKKQASDAKDKVKDVLEIGKNSGGPLQPETTADIERLQKAVDLIAVPWSTLPFKKAHYQSLADDIWKELISPVNIDEGKLFGWVDKLKTSELKAIAKCFGLKEPGFVGLTVRTLNICQAFQWKLTDGVFGNDLTRMRQIWAKTGLWA